MIHHQKVEHYTLHNDVIKSSSLIGQIMIIIMMNGEGFHCCSVLKCGA